MTQQERISNADRWTEKQQTGQRNAREYALSHEFKLLDRVLTQFGAGSIIGFNPENSEGLTHQVLLDSYADPMGFHAFELQPEPTGKPLSSRNNHTH